MCKKKCAILARYYNETQGKVTLGFVYMPVCNDAKAENILNWIPSSIYVIETVQDLAVTTAMWWLAKNNCLSRPLIFTELAVHCHLVSILAKIGAKELCVTWRTAHWHPLLLWEKFQMRRPKRVSRVLQCLTSLHPVRHCGLDHQLL